MPGSADSFVHLHVHTEYSMLDGASLLDGLFERTAELGMPAIAMTDHGNVHGAYDFYAKARRAGVKPIIGMEAYLTPGTSRFDKKRVRWNQGGEADVSGGGAYTHMTDRKSTRLNSSHVANSYAGFCLKKKTTSNANSRPAGLASSKPGERRLNQQRQKWPPGPSQLIRDLRRLGTDSSEVHPTA